MSESGALAPSIWGGDDGRMEGKENNHLDQTRRKELRG